MSEFEILESCIVAIDMDMQDFDLPSAHVSLSDGDATSRPDHVVLYTAQAYRDIRSESELIQTDGRIDLLRLLENWPGGNFSGSFLAHYWTPDKETAGRQREWAARRCPNSDTCMIRIELSNAFLNSLSSAELRYSLQWKEVVWGSRRHRRLDDYEDIDLIKGHICTGLNGPIIQIGPADVWTSITRDHLLQCASTGRPAIQWMFRGDKTVERLQDEIRGKMHIDIFAPAG